MHNAYTIYNVRLFILLVTVIQIPSIYRGHINILDTTTRGRWHRVLIGARLGVEMLQVNYEQYW